MVSVDLEMLLGKKDKVGTLGLAGRDEVVRSAEDSLFLFVALLAQQDMALLAQQHTNDGI